LFVQVRLLPKHCVPWQHGWLACPHASHWFVDALQFAWPGLHMPPLQHGVFGMPHPPVPLLEPLVLPVMQPMPGLQAPATHDSQVHWLPLTTGHPPPAVHCDIDVWSHPGGTPPSALPGTQTPATHVVPFEQSD
jgi:hypothetical protein